MDPDYSDEMLRQLYSVNNETCQATDNVTPFERTLFVYLYPFIALLCFLGNAANLFVYNHQFLRTSTTIRLLTIKAVANTLHLAALLPMHISSVSLLFPDSHYIPKPYYFKSLKYVLFFANVFNTIAVWLTAAVSIENCLLVVLPVKAKIWCTMSTAWATIGCCIFFAYGLHSFNIFARQAREIDCFDLVSRNLTIGYTFEPLQKYDHLEIVYYWLNAFTITCLPMMIMVTAACLIYYRLYSSRPLFRCTEQKRCVVRLSFATAVCHVIFQMPHFVVFAVVALSSSTAVASWIHFVTLNTVANFLSQLNAAVPFFVYVACSSRFRQIFMVVLGRDTLFDTYYSTTGGGLTHAQRVRLSECVVLSGRRSVSHHPLSMFSKMTAASPENARICQQAQARLNDDREEIASFDQRHLYSTRIPQQQQQEHEQHLRFESSQPAVDKASSESTGLLE